jgi:hypothetical protein
VLRGFPERFALTDLSHALVASRRKPKDADLEHITLLDLHVLPKRIDGVHERIAIDHAFLAHDRVAQREAEPGHVDLLLGVTTPEQIAGFGWRIADS